MVKKIKSSGTRPDYSAVRNFHLGSTRPTPFNSYSSYSSVFNPVNDRDDRHLSLSGGSAVVTTSDEWTDVECPQNGAVGYTINYKVVTTTEDACLPAPYYGEQDQRRHRRRDAEVVDSPLERQGAAIAVHLSSSIKCNSKDHHHTTRTKRKGYPFGSGHVCRDETEDKELVKDTMTPYIGKVLINNIFTESCLLIGNPKEPCVLTCYHGIRKVFKYEDDQLQCVTVTVQGITYKVKQEVKKVCVFRDYIVLKLEITSTQESPKTWRRFGPVPKKDFPIFIIGYQDDELHIDDSAVVLNDNPAERVHKAKNMGASPSYNKLLNTDGKEMEDGKVLVQTRLENGSSGGIGVYRDDRGDLQVILMYQEGHPSEYYHLSNREKETFKSILLIEQGIALTEIYQHIKEQENSCITKDESTCADVLFEKLNIIGIN